MRFSSLYKCGPVLSLFWLSLLLLTACGDITATPTPAIQNAAQPTATAQPSRTLPPTTNLTPAPTLVNTTSLATIAECRAENLEVKANWDDPSKFGSHRSYTQIVGALSFTNRGANVCSLPNAPQLAFIDNKNQPVTLKQKVTPAQPTEIQPGQTLSVALDLTNTCIKLLSSAGKEKMTLKISMGNELNFSLASTLVALALPECDYNLQVGPYEGIVGTAFTATAAVTQATARSQYLTSSAITAAYQTAHPPTPVPTPTVIPTIVPNAKPCAARDLELEQGMQSGATGRMWDFWYLVNQGANVCTIKGYPSVRWTDSTGQPVQNVKLHHGSSLSRTPPPAEADTPLVGVLPGQAALFVTESYSCSVQWGKEKFKVYLVLPNGQGEIYWYDANKCPDPEYINPIGVSAFDYAPGNWREQP